MDKDCLSLLELNSRIKNSIRQSFTEKIWVVAELSEIHTNTSGHCYLELIEKDQLSDRIIARMRATIWAYTYRMLRPYFEKATGLELTAGLKLMLQVNVEFHEVYSISLNVKDIDPGYTLGDLARKKQEIINKLVEAGVFDMNRELPMPLVPQRLAVVSSETAAGLGDFTHSLETNNRNFRFDITLFPAIMQGDQASESIIAAFEKIFERSENFDAVIIIRGGGSQADLECFNSYELAYIITQFPLPVFTGIGHERDMSIADMVAHTSLKTPTAVAAFLIDGMTGFDDRLTEWEGKMNRYLSTVLSTERNKMKAFEKLLSVLVNSVMTEEKRFLLQTRKALNAAALRYLLQKRENLKSDTRLTEIYTRNRISAFRKENERWSSILIPGIERYFSAKKLKMENLELNRKHLDPVHILERGFTITRYGGKVVKDPSILKPGDNIKTTYYNSITESTITRVENKNTGKNE